MPHEVVIADDASDDGSVQQVLGRFPWVRVVRHDQRQGAAPTKALGARHASGEVLIFLDGHCLPERGAINRLIQDVELLKGQAVVTPAIAALDARSWRNDPTQIGHGYFVELHNFNCGWRPLSSLRPLHERGRHFYESPALIGCVLAVSRDLYEQLWGFDAHMRSWGVEDLDFGLKCWLMGHRILHDPEAVVGHRFRQRFDNFEVPVEHLVVNQLRMARKNFTHAVWFEWVEHCRQRHPGQLLEYPEGLWARSWMLFEENRASAEQERAYLHAWRTWDEFWYAKRFGLGWPTLGTQAQIRFAEPTQFVQAQASPSQPPEAVIGPKHVPGLSVYQYELEAGDAAITDIAWSSSSEGASIVAGENELRATVQFQNLAQWVELKVTFKSNGQPRVVTINVAVVKVEPAAPEFNAGGLYGGRDPAPEAEWVPFLVDPPVDAPAQWVMSDPEGDGSDCGAFVPGYNGTIKPKEKTVEIWSNEFSEVSALEANTTVRLTSPAEKSDAHTRIEVGFILHAICVSGTATYANDKKRIMEVPEGTSLDWLTKTCSPFPSDEWPWYDSGEDTKTTGKANENPSEVSLRLVDSPQAAVPAEYAPLNDDTTALVSANALEEFLVRLGTRTLDTELDGTKSFFEVAKASGPWKPAFEYPIATKEEESKSITTAPESSWIIPESPVTIDVNRVPAVTYCEGAPYLRYEHE